MKPVPESWDVTMGLIQKKDHTMIDHNIYILIYIIYILMTNVYDRYTMTNI